MRHCLPFPGVKPLKSMSPSRYQGVSECLLREALAVCSSPYIPPSPVAAMGNVSHRIVEEASRGAVGPERVSFEARWSELIQDTEKKLSGSILTQFQVPLTKSCPDFFVRKAVTMRAAARNYKPPLAYQDSGKPRRAGAEVTLATLDGKLRARIDYIERVNTDVVIRDYKTGAITDPDCDGAIKRDYQKQLKLYSAIFAEVTGEWPIRAELVPMAGPSLGIEVDPAECSALATEARRCLEESNALLNRIVGGESEVIAAKPSPVACRFCSFRPCCAAYHEVRIETPVSEDSLDEQWPNDIWGTIVSVKLGPENRWIVEILTKNGTHAIARRMTASRYQDFGSLALGTPISVYSLKKENAPHVFKEGPSTALYFHSPTGYN